MLHCFGAKIRRREGRGELASDAAHFIHVLRIGVGGINFVPLTEQVEEISAGTTSGVQDPHSGQDATFEKLVEKIDVDRTELFLERGHERLPTIASR
jgi:hypothetical protein